MNESLRCRIREFLIRTTVAHHTPRGLIARMVNAVFGTTAEATYVFEHSSCDEGRSHCAGAIVGAWYAYDDGLHETDPTPESVPNERRGMWYRFARMHFYISPDADWIVHERLEGPRAGGGGCFRVTPKGNNFELSAIGSHWKT